MEKANYLNPQIAEQQLKKEYPELFGWDIVVEKQLAAGPGRLSNAFVVSCKNPNAPYAKFVAKAAPPHANNMDGVQAEWHSLLHHGGNAR